MKKSILITLLICIILCSIIPINAQNEENSLKAEVIELNEIKEVVQDNKPTKKVQSLKIRILEGEYENEEYELEHIICEDITNSIVSNVELEQEDNILISIEEKDGEITNINFVKVINQNYMLYIIGSVLIFLILVMGKRKIIKTIITYLLVISLSIYIFNFTIKNGWNLILTSSIISIGITIFIAIKLNGISKKTISMTIICISKILVAGIIMNILFEIMNINNINIKISENFVNIKELFYSIAILLGAGVSNIFVAIKDINFLDNKSYKTKSDNIIEGQRSLKL